MGITVSPGEVSGMKLSKLLIYMLILAALGAWLYFYETKYKGEKKAAEEQASKIVAINKDQVVQIGLKTKDGATIEIKKPADAWVLTAPVQTKADQSAIGSLLQSAVSAQSEKILMDKDVNWAEYGLDNPSFSVDLAVGDGHTELLFGESNPSKTAYYVRISGDPRLFLVADTLKNSLNKTVFDLRDKTVVGMAPSDVDRIVITQKGDEIELKRESPEKWVMTKPEEMRVKNALANRDLNSLTNLSAKEIIDEPSSEGDPYGLKNPEKQIVLAGPKLEQTLLIGAVNKEGAQTSGGDVYARIKGRDTVYVIDGKNIKGLMQPDRTLLRDRSIVSFNPADVEKLDIDLDGRKWVAVRNADKKWTLEQPEKIGSVDSWLLTSILWDLKELEWKNMLKTVPDDLSGLHLSQPQLVASIFRKDEKEPIVLKAGWDPTPPAKDAQKEPSVKTEVDQGKAEQKDGQGASVSGSDLDEKPLDNASVSPAHPATVNMIAEPNDDKAGAFEVTGAFVGRLRKDLERIVSKK